MALHLIKLCVGCDSVKDLRSWIREKLQEKKRRKLPLEHWHITRMVPKRAAELTDGGSLYWVIRGEILCRQRIVDVRPFRDGEGIGRCRLVLEPKLVLTEPRAFRAFQGWRELDARRPPEGRDRGGSGGGAVEVRGGASRFEIAPTLERRR